jgi:hypothetical protein
MLIAVANEQASWFIYEPSGKIALFQSGES